MSTERRLMEAQLLRAKILKERKTTIEGLDQTPLTEQMGVIEDQIIPLREQKDFIANNAGAPFNDPNFNLGGMSEGIRSLQREKDILESGVETRIGNSEARFDASFAASEDIATDFVRRKMSEKTGRDIPARIGPVSGELEIFDPETNRFILHDEVQLTTSDLKDIAGGSLVFGGDAVGALIGSVLGAYATKNPAGVVTGEAAGSFLGAKAGETAKLRIGEELGVNVGLTDEQVSEISNQQGLNAMTGALVARGLMSAGSRILKGKRAFSPEESEKIVESMAESDAIIHKINTRIDNGESFDPTTAQRSGLPSVLDDEATVAGQEVGFDKLFRERQLRNEAALVDFYNASFDMSGGTALELAEKAQRGLIELPSMRLARAQEASTKASRVAQTELENIPVLDLPLAGQNIRKALLESRQIMMNYEKAAWRRVDDLSGLDAETFNTNIKIPRSEQLGITLSTLSAESKASLIGGESAVKNKIISRLLQKEDDGISILGANGKPLVTIKPDGEPIDFAHIGAAISRLKKEIRVSSKGLSREDPSVRDLKRLKTSLEGMRNGWLRENYPEMLSEVLSAEKATADVKRLFDRGLAGRFLKEASPGEFVMDDASVFVSIFRSGNASSAKELAQIVSGDLRAGQSIRQNISSLYRREVEVEGIPDLRLHKKFMTDFKDVISPFFNKDQMKQINSLGEMAFVVAKNARKIKKGEEDFTKSFRGKIADMNPESIAKAFFGTARRESKTSFNQADARSLRTFGNSTGTSEAVSKVLTDEINRKVFRGGRFSEKALDDLLLDHGGKIKGFFGSQYFDDLVLLKDAAKIINKKGSRAAKETPPLPVTLFRAILGPLNRRQRLITFGQTVKATASDAAIASAMLDPAKLGILVKNANVNANSKRGIAILSSLGALDILSVE